MGKAMRWGSMVVALAVNATAGAATPDSRFIAPAGLYEVEAKISGMPSMPGQGAQRVCVPAAKPGARLDALPPQMQAQGCVGKPGVVKGDRMEFRSSCQGKEMLMTMRQLDAKTWETALQMLNTGAEADDEMAGRTTVIRMRRVAEKCK